MKDKDSRLIWESWRPEVMSVVKKKVYEAGGDLHPDGSKMERGRKSWLDSLRRQDEEEIPGHDDDDPVYDEVRELEQKDILDKLKAGSTELEDMEVGKDIIGFTIQFQDNKWWKLTNQEEVEDENADPQWVEVTSDEKFDIWSIEDPDSYAQHKAEGEGMQRHLRQTGL